MARIALRLPPLALSLGLIAVLVCFPQVYAHAQSGATMTTLDIWNPAWLGLIIGALGALFGAAGTAALIRRDVSGLNTAVFGSKGDQKDGLISRVGVAEKHAEDANIHTPQVRIVGVEACRLQRLDCAAARTEAMHALHEDFRRLEDKLDRLIERP